MSNLTADVIIVHPWNRFDDQGGEEQCTGSKRYESQKEVNLLSVLVKKRFSIPEKQ